MDEKKNNIKKEKNGKYKPKHFTFSKKDIETSNKKKKLQKCKNVEFIILLMCT